MSDRVRAAGPSLGLGPRGGVWDGASLGSTEMAQFWAVRRISVCGRWSAPLAATHLTG